MDAAHLSRITVAAVLKLDWVTDAGWAQGYCDNLHIAVRIPEDAVAH